MEDDVDVGHAKRHGTTTLDIALASSDGLEMELELAELELAQEGRHHCKREAGACLAEPQGESMVELGEEAAVGTDVGNSSRAAEGMGKRQRKILSIFAGNRGNGALKRRLTVKVILYSLYFVAFVAIVAFTGVYNKVWLTGVFGFLPFFPFALAWLLLFYWRQEVTFCSLLSCGVLKNPHSHREKANISTVAEVLGSGHICDIAVAFSQLTLSLGLRFCVVWLLELPSIGRNAFATAVLGAFALLLEALCLMALPDELLKFALVKRLVPLGEIPNRYSAVTLGMCAGLGVGCFQVTFYCLFLYWTGFFTSLGIALIFLVDDCFLTITMHAITGIWVGFGITKRYFPSNVLAEDLHMDADDAPPLDDESVLTLTSVRRVLTIPIAFNFLYNSIYLLMVRLEGLGLSYPFAVTWLSTHAVCALLLVVMSAYTVAQLRRVYFKDSYSSMLQIHE